MIIDFDSHLREGYFMDEVYKLEGSYERFRPVKLNDGRTHRKATPRTGIPTYTTRRPIGAAATSRRGKWAATIWRAVVWTSARKASTSS
jgi:hypothetical protein